MKLFWISSKFVSDILDNQCSLYYMNKYLLLLKSNLLSLTTTVKLVVCYCNWFNKPSAFKTWNSFIVKKYGKME